MRTYAWLVLVAAQWHHQFVADVAGVIEEPLQLAHNLTGSIIGMVHIMLPFLILPLYATMRSIDTDLVRAAVGLGSSPRGILARVLPDVAAGSFCRHRAGLHPVARLLRHPCFAGRWPGADAGAADRKHHHRLFQLGSGISLGRCPAMYWHLVMIWLMNRVFGLDKLFMR